MNTTAMGIFVSVIDGNYYSELCREQTPALTRQSQLCKGKSGGVMMELQHNAISKKI